MVQDDDLDDEIIEISSASDMKPTVRPASKSYIACHVKVKLGV